jgi:hypothetical protein
VGVFAPAPALLRLSVTSEKNLAVDLMQFGGAAEPQNRGQALGSVPSRLQAAQRRRDGTTTVTEEASHTPWTVDVCPPRAGVVAQPA